MHIGHPVHTHSLPHIQVEVFKVCVCVCVHVTQRAPLHPCHIPCGTAAYPCVSWPARQSEPKMSSVAWAFPGRLPWPRLTIHPPQVLRPVKSQIQGQDSIFPLLFQSKRQYFQICWQNPTSNKISLITKPLFYCIWFEGIFHPHSQEIHEFTVAQWAVDQVSVMRLVKNIFSWSTSLLSAHSCQIWDKSFKRSTKETFASSYYYNLSFSDDCVLHERTGLACVTAMPEKATLQGTINSKHNRYTKKESGAEFQSLVWKSGRGSGL